MEKLQIELKMESSNETCSSKRVFCGILIFVVVGLIGWNSYLTPKTIELEHEINSLKKENEYHKEKVHPRNGKISVEHDLRLSFKDINEDVNILKATVGNLSAFVSRMNSSSMSRLRGGLNETNDDLIRLQNDMTQLNKSIHKDIMPFLISAVKDVRHELNTLRKLTTANVSELWKHWNHTDATTEDILKLITQQNETIHFKIAYHSDRLYSEVKDIEKNQSMLREYTDKNMKDIRNDINQTRQNLQRYVDHELAQTNTSWHKQLQDIDKSLRMSMAKINVKTDGIKQQQQQLQKSVDNIAKKQKATSDAFSKTKQEFQEKDGKHDSDISSQGSEIKKMKTRIETLEGKLDLKTKTNLDLQRKVQNLENSVKKLNTEVKNKGNRLSGSYAPLILVFLYIFLFFTC